MVQGDLQFPCGGIAVGVETLPIALGSKAYMYILSHLAQRMQKMRDVSMQVKGSVKVYGVLDAVEYKMRFPKDLDRLCSVDWYIYGYVTSWS